MIKVVKFTFAAQKDIETIYDYTLDTWGPAQADHYLKLLEVQINNVPSGISVTRRFNTWREGGIVTSAGRHKIFLLETETEFLVVRILHQSRDFLRHLSTVT